MFHRAVLVVAIVAVVSTTEWMGQRTETFLLESFYLEFSNQWTDVVSIIRCARKEAKNQEEEWWQRSNPSNIM